jgi:flavin reductase (DIM6/NTAB) family NADH-FMN oxidoreductase RutF
VAVNRAAHLAATQPEADATNLRDVMSQFATGITVLTAGGEHCHGMTANAFTSVSLDPPLVLCCVAATARMHSAITATRSFGVSMLGADQEPVARHFADRRRPYGIEQFSTTQWRPGPKTGAPVLANSLAWLECELAESYDGGDHSIFLGQVVGLGRRAGGGAPLLFFGGDFHHVRPARSA